MSIALSPLSEDQTSQIFSSKKSHAMDLTPYKDELQKLESGQGAQLSLSDEERRKVVRAYNRAAKQIGLKLKWLHDGDQTYLRVVGSPGDVQENPSEDGQPEPIEGTRGSRRRAA